MLVKYFIAERLKKGYSNVYSLWRQIDFLYTLCEFFNFCVIYVCRLYIFMNYVLSWKMESFSGGYLGVLYWEVKVKDE